MSINTVISYIEANKDRYLDMLMEACSQPSISPTNTGMTEMADLVIKSLGKISAAPERIKTQGYDYVFGQIDAKQKKTVTFYNHYDVQPPDPLDQWESEPFTPTCKDGKIFARGVADNKGSLYSRICAADAFLATGTQLPVNLKFLVEGEEEIGSPNLEYFLKNYPDKVATDAFIWEGGKRDLNRGPLQIAVGFKGICYLELRAKSSKTDTHSMNAGIIPSAAWRLIWALASMKDPETCKIKIDGFYDGLVLPNEFDLSYLDKIRFDESDFAESFGIDHFVNNLRGFELKKEYVFGPTCNVAGLVSGWTGKGVKTVLPSVATCKMDFRLVQGQTGEGIYQMVCDHMTKHGFNDIEVKLMSSRDPYTTCSNHPIVLASIDSAREIYGMDPSIYPVAPGTTSMGVICGPTKIPGVAFGIDHLESNIHAPNENIYIEDYIAGIKMTALTLDHFAKFD